jgi:hypothetical protein
MGNEEKIFDVLRHHGVPFVVIGGLAVNVHGFGRATEDTDIVWIRSPQTEQALLRALIELDSQYIGDDIDPSTKVERAHPVTMPFIQSNHVMLLTTRLGFLDLFDHIPGFPQEDAAQLLGSAVESGGVKYASLPWLRRMKAATGRQKDKLDLENLPE